MFKLNIECTKDIDELHINFSDGSTTVVSNASRDSEKCKSTKQQPEKQKEVVQQVKESKLTKEQFLDTDTDFGDISQEVIKPPKIESSDRPVKVAEELQNFDF